MYEGIQRPLVAILGFLSSQISLTGASRTFSPAREPNVSRLWSIFKSSTKNSRNCKRNSTKEKRLLSRWQRPTSKSFLRSEEHTSELQSLMRKQYAVFCL